MLGSLLSRTSTDGLNSLGMVYISLLVGLLDADQVWVGEWWHRFLVVFSQSSRYHMLGRSPGSRSGSSLIEGRWVVAMIFNRSQ